MRLTTRITIGDNTEEFFSSEDTLRTNVYATLRIRGVNLDVCHRVHDALLGSDVRQFRFHDGDVAVEAEESSMSEKIPSLLSA